MPHGGNLFSADIITTRSCKDENIGMLCFRGAHNSRDTIAAGAQAMQRGLGLESNACISLYFQIALPLIATIMLSTSSELSSGMVMTESPEVAVQVILVLLIQVVNPCRQVSFGIDGFTG